MSPENDENDENTFDSECVVCNLTVRGTNYVSLALFGVFGMLNGGQDGLLFTPSEEKWQFAEWSDVPHYRAVHIECAQAYFEGVLADLLHRRKTGKSE